MRLVKPFRLQQKHAKGLNSQKQKQKQGGDPDGAKTT